MLCSSGILLRIFNLKMYRYLTMNLSLFLGTTEILFVHYYTVPYCTTKLPTVKVTDRDLRIALACEYVT